MLLLIDLTAVTVLLLFIVNTVKGFASQEDFNALNYNVKFRMTIDNKSKQGLIFEKMGKQSTNQANMLL